MIHRWQVTDARSQRKLLDPDIFLNGSNPPPTDLLPFETWAHIMHLPDHVSITTSNHHGRILQSLHHLERGWVDAIGDSRDWLSEALVDVMDELPACIFLLLHGFYRQATSSLRSVLESTLVGAYVQLSADNALFRRWRSGEEISFGRAADLLPKIPRAAALETRLRSTASDDLLSQRSRHFKGGWARRLYQELCRYAHSRPGFSNADLWRSNGPIYVPTKLRRFAALYVETYALGLVLVALARPRSPLPSTVPRGYEKSHAKWARLAKTCHKFLK